MNIIKNTAEYDETLKNNKSVFVDFYADWCGPCKMLGPVVEQLAGENSDVTFIKVNVDDNPEVAERYGIMPAALLASSRKKQFRNSSIKQSKKANENLQR